LTKRVSISESQLVALLKERNEQAFTILYDNYSAVLYGIIFKIVNDEDRAKDILQDAFIKIWRSFESYDSAKGSIFTWMLNIARNSAIDNLRSKSNRVEIRNDDSGVSMTGNDTMFLHHLDYIGMKEVLAGLKDDYRNVIDILYFKGYTQEEAARVMNIPLGTVKTRARAAISILRNLLMERNSGY
jgi:RNA polymerase sigma-70 factor, ECF subfamily